MPSPTILFEDTHLIVLDKPAGLLSQGEISGDENLVDWLRQYLGRPYVGLIHRLDRNTSGIMVVAKRTKSAQRLTASLQEGRLDRTYLAWVIGRLDHPQEWTHFLWKDESKNIVRVLSPAEARQRKGAKEARLRATPLQTAQAGGSPLTLVEFHLETGRSHQIRVQAAAEKLPLLGDVKYGETENRRLKPFTFPRPALHSHRLSFDHPMSKEIVTFEAPLPEDMKKVSASFL